MTENAKKVVEEIKKIYLEEDICMFELLADIKTKSEWDISFEDAFAIYGELMEWANGDFVKLYSYE